MPLPTPDYPRQPIHTRSIRVQSYGRDDGLWDLEAELIDYKGYDFTKSEGEVMKAGQHIHHMHLRITIDESYTIVAAQAAYDAAPYDASCTAIDKAYAGLVGMNLLKGFRHQVKDRFSGIEGCTHMTELSLVLPTAAVQTMAGRRREQNATSDRRPFQLDGCHALRTDGEVVLQHYPRWYTGRSDSQADESDSEAGPRSIDSPSFSHTS
ncbi:Protein of uncharacterised function (DUF2889) [Bordetella ansorpii]|uniref:Protein of uncharacterized function (DUF2889) n=1 Tax=Bordetella ansorpii TaxID=288768 RepID=A0A157RG69_9BORD|nr:DUF2889 domain-containing protein [Bordetella ansorpii]SAI57002.1 Protein of uncharacterised function (DUF2889) [Bordetella ansorpii]